MKTPIFSIYICLTIMAGILVASCDKGDNVKPVINLIEPEEGDVLQIGGDVHFEMKLSDDVALGSYKVDIHHNFDNHGHEKSGEETETVPFEFSREWVEDIAGKKNATVHHHEIVIPENATEGAYHLMVYCTDAAGNEAYVTVNVELSHEGEEHEHDE
ncbi:MAG: DUF4625 domain-containing protein [Bacteroidales bacterium]|jgi:uncharacterized membrane protein|nr:DUF4625 domain-containing protein [Bacteroidales bacterium]